MAATIQYIVVPKPAPKLTDTPVTKAIDAATTIIAVVELGGGMVAIYFV